jgi:GNAT superfamily N-acetyltransferase
MTMPQIFSDRSLAQQLERAEATAGARFVEASAQARPERGATWMECGGAFALFDGPLSPATQTFGLGMFEDASPRILETLEKFFDDRGAPVFHEVSPLAGIPTAALLHSRGYAPMEFTSILYRPLEAGPAESRAAGITVRVIGNHEAALWARVSAEGWAVDQPEMFDFLSSLMAVNAERGDFVAFLAEHDGEPAAAGGLGIAHGVAMFAGAATIPSKRNLGLQHALLAARLKHAKTAGCDLAMMGALPGSSSQRNAERHGFRIAYTRIKWARAG